MLTEFHQLCLGVAEGNITNKTNVRTFEIRSFSFVHNGFETAVSQFFHQVRQLTQSVLLEQEEANSVRFPLVLLPYLYTVFDVLEDVLVLYNQIVYTTDIKHHVSEILGLGQAKHGSTQQQPQREESAGQGDIFVTEEYVFDPLSGDNLYVDPARLASHILKGSYTHLS